MDQFVVSARKFRPVKFSEVVGQEHVTQTLKNAIKNQQLAQAFLFCGPRGIGKTTCARILAKTINCENITTDTEACGECRSCLSFQQSASFNIHELDGASNNSVDDMRALIEQVRYMPQAGKFKIYIIDEVHMLSQSAFNAFLKTLEEPPPYAIFILATTEKHKILPTILSRCQIFDFNRIGVKDITDHLADICQKEKIEFDADALHIIAQKADGALRDALSIFDRTVSFGNGSIRFDEVIRHLNVLDYEYFFQIIDQALAEDSSAMLTSYNDILSKGFEGDIFLEGFSQHLRDLLVSKDPETINLLEISDGLKPRYAEQAAYTSQSFLISGLNIANQFAMQYKMSRNKRLHIELFLLKMAYLSRAITGDRQEIQKKKPVENNGDTSLTKKDKAPIALKSKPPEPKQQLPAKEMVEEEKKQPGALSPEAEEPSEKSGPDPIPTPTKTTNGTGKKGLKLGKLEDLYDSLDTEAESNPDDEQEKQPEIDEKIQLDQTILKTAWKKAAEQQNEKNNDSCAAILRNYSPVSSHNKVVVRVLNDVEKKIISTASDAICQTLRTECGHSSIFLHIDLENDPEILKTKRKPYSPAEKYKHLKEKNPAIEDLRKGLDLELEY